MIVVSDTTPLISLLKIDQLNLLSHYFHEVWIPMAVFEELVSNPRFEEEANQIKICPFLNVVKVENEKSVHILQRTTGLDRGESEAIILSDEFCADLLLMDEMKGRQVAEQLDIPIMGTIGLLLAAYEDGRLSADEIKKSISLLRMSGRHIGERYYHLLLERINK